MATNPTNIDRLRIATPCPIGWEQMTGDNRVRFCDHCQLNVYNIAELSRIEAETLIASTEGRLCARLFLRADGTILTKDCPVGLRALRMRVSKRAAAVFAAIVSLAGMAFGQHASSKNSCTPQTKVTRTNATSKPGEKILSGTVIDPNGAVVPGVKLKLTNAEAKAMGQTSTDAEGRFDFGPIAAGDYSITLLLSGFKPLQIKSVTVERDKLTSLDIILLPTMQTETVGIIGEESLIDSPHGTTIFNEKMIQSLPH